MPIYFKRMERVEKRVKKDGKWQRIIETREVWLRIKDIHPIIRGISKRRGRRKTQQASTSPSQAMLVAEAVEKPKLNGFKYRSEVPISASKVTRFMVLLHQRNPPAIVVVEPRGDDYAAIIYARTKRDLDATLRIVSDVVRYLGAEVTEEEEVEEEAVEEEEGEEE